MSEVNIFPVLCTRCGVEMKIVGVGTRVPSPTIKCNDCILEENKSNILVMKDAEKQSRLKYFVGYVEGSQQPFERMVEGVVKE